jgi:hypothetical protein
VAVFERLPKAVQDRPPELGRLIQKQDAVMSQGHLPGTGDRSSSDESGVRNAVMGRPERSNCEKASVGG